MRAGIFASARVAAGGGGPITGTFLQSLVDVTDTSTPSFAAQPIGTASATRRVVVALGWASAGAVSFTSATIGGVSATLDADSLNASGNRRAVIFSAVVPSGTTGTVAATLSGTVVRVGGGMWHLTNGSPTGQTAAVINSGSGSLDVTTLAGDFVVASGFSSNSTMTAVSWTWTGADERYDEAVTETTASAASGADVVAVGSLTSVSFTTTATAQRATCAAGYR